MSDNGERSSQRTSGPFDEQQTSSELSRSPGLTSAAPRVSEEVTYNILRGRTPEGAGEERLDTSSARTLETVGF